MKNKEGKLITESISWKEITPGGTVYESGSASNFNTGDWRTMRPIYKPENCKQCLLCVPVCPDMSIELSEGKMTGFNYFHCKGCGICVKACPFNAIDFIKEEK